MLPESRDLDHVCISNNTVELGPSTESAFERYFVMVSLSFPLSKHPTTKGHLVLQSCPVYSSHGWPLGPGAGDRVWAAKRIVYQVAPCEVKKNEAAGSDFLRALRAPHTGAFLISAPVLLLKLLLPSEIPTSLPKSYPPLRSHSGCFSWIILTLRAHGDSALC